MSNKNLIVIVGPTAIGKTSLAIGLANKLACEIISADSRQFYREIAIGTAKPSENELNAAPHHFIDNLSIHDEYSAGQFEIDALKCLETLFLKSNYAIVVGGSGMYINAICKGIDLIPSSKEIRGALNLEYKTNGIKPLQDELKLLDPEHFNNMDTQNPQRLIRALEVCRFSGKSYSSFRNNKDKKRSFNIIKIGLFNEREILHERINLRVDQMIHDGLLNEIKENRNNSKLNALNTVGYKELFNYLNKQTSLNDAIEEIKRNTRKFAKRQMTWFKKDKEINWFKEPKLEEVHGFIKENC
ncbi:MAG: tRNA (adenosine(37)-N6)-dimethylallyltransferase MiaA [Parvicellaceae bacterium]